LYLIDWIKKNTQISFHLSTQFLMLITFLSVVFDIFQVTDTNDNPPSFTEAAYSFDIPENAPRGYQVGLISATDPDLGANSMLTYTVISDWANDVFSLNPQTGVFTLTARLDYEEVRNLLLVGDQTK
jgi:protocadherin Fat 4